MNKEQLLWMAAIYSFVILASITAQAVLSGKNKWIHTSQLRSDLKTSRLWSLVSQNGSTVR